MPESSRGSKSTDSLAGPFQPAKDAAKTEASARGAFEKLGDTRLQPGKFAFSNPDGLFVPVSQMNELRRQIAANIEKQLTEKSALRVRHIRGRFVFSSFPIPHTPSPLPLVPQGRSNRPAEELRGRGLERPGRSRRRDRGRSCRHIEDPPEAAAPRSRPARAPDDHAEVGGGRDLADKIVELQRAGWTKWEIANVSGLECS